MTDEEVLNQLRAWGADVYLTGSRAICENPPEDSDTDYLISGIGMGPIINFMHVEGFEEASGKEYDDDTQWSFKRGKLNLILAQDEEFAKDWKAATEEAKRLHLKTRAERVTLFRKMVDKETELDEHIPF